MLKFSKLKIIILIPACIFLLSAQAVSAAQISVDSSNKEVAIGQQFEVTVFVNTANEDINAVEGKIIYPSDLLALKEIRDGSSIINFWVDRPRASGDNEVVFSGIIPGGYDQSKGELFSLIFSPQKQGQGAIDIQASKVLLNDGKGTEANLTVSPYQFNIAQILVPGETVLPETSSVDKEPPETFTPEVARDPNIFNGQWFLVFATQDKGAGIDHYEIKETASKNQNAGKWLTGESPYLLKDQNLSSYIYVRAIDKSGNQRLEILSPQNPLPWYKNYLIWGIIILLILTPAAYLLMRKFSWKRKK